MIAVQSIARTEAGKRKSDMGKKVTRTRYDVGCGVTIDFVTHIDVETVDAGDGVILAYATMDYGFEIRQGESDEDEDKDRRQGKDS